MAKTHSRWSASASARSMACPGSIALTDKSPPGTSSIYAAWGTAMHTVIESCLREDIEPGTFLGSLLPVDNFGILVDDELLDAAQVCINYVRSLAATAGAELWLEEQFDLSPLGLPIESGGTSDAVLWLPAAKTIEIVDYKGGRGHRVDANENSQTMHYGLGTMIKHPHLPAERVKMTIIQPRIPDPEGVVRSSTVHVSDLVDFANDILAAQKQALLAIADLQAGHFDLQAWGRAWLVPGEHCQFCPAAGDCPALRAKAQELVGLHWDDGVPAVTTSMSPEAVERDLDVLDLIEHWIAERRAHAHQLAEGGHQFDHWMLVERNGHRKWTAKPEDAAAAEIIKATGLSLVEIYDRKLKSPAGIEKVLGKAKGKIADLFHTPVIGKDLVRRSIAGRRQPAQSLVESFFNSET